MDAADLTLISVSEARNPITPSERLEQMTCLGWQTQGFRRRSRCSGRFGFRGLGPDSGFKAFCSRDGSQRV